MICKHCKRPIEATIEGTNICPTCFDPEDILPDQEAIQWLKSHCMDCGKLVRGGGYCPDCQAENDQIMADLILEHQGKTAFVHWRGPGAYVPTKSRFDNDIFYYLAGQDPYSGNRPADGWPTINVREWADFGASLDDHGVYVCCMTGMERKDYVPESDL